VATYKRKGSLKTKNSRHTGILFGTSSLRQAMYVLYKKKILCHRKMIYKEITITFV
jgi:hypothetical protein